jgi:hypothetical protein
MNCFLPRRLGDLRLAISRSWNECIKSIESSVTSGSAQVRLAWMSIVGVAGASRCVQNHAYSFHLQFLVSHILPSRLFLAGVLVLFINAPEGTAQADVSTATLTGKVIDQSGATVSNVAVTVTSVERGWARTVTSNDEGMYRFPLLQPGPYSIRITAPGFRPQILNGISLTIGQAAVVNVQLQVGPVSAELVVPAEATLVGIQRTQQSETVERRQIAKLPNLTRNFTSYMSILPGVVDVSAVRAQQTRITNIPTSGFSFVAGNGRSNYISIDGGENESGTGSLRIRNLSIEALQEFQVNRNAYAAEYGFTAGTAINAVTRSGTNDVHGSGYAFYRSDKTAARDPMNTSGREAFEQRVSPGFTLSGPISKDRAFFFTSFEALKYDVARFRAYTSNPSLLQPTGAQSSFLEALTSGPSATDTTRSIAIRLRSALTSADNPTLMRILRESEGQFTAPSRRYNWTTRLDYDRGERDFFTGRFTLSREYNDLLRADNAEAPTNGVIENVEDYTAVATWNHIFTDNFLNQLRVQVAASDYRQVSSAPGTSQITIAGLLNYGRLGTVPLVIDQTRYQIDDILIWSRGTKDFKAGVSYRPVDARLITEIGFPGTFQFVGGLPLSRVLSTAELGVLAGSLSPPADTSLTSLQALNSGIPSVWQQGFGNPGFQAWQHNLGAFGQVGWKVTPGLTVNLGARLNYDGEPRPLDRNITVSPRVGFAWDPFGEGETVIRGGFGTFYAPAGLQVLLSATLLDDDRFIISQTRSLADGAQSSQALWAYGVGLGKLPFAGLTEEDIRAFGIVPSPGQPNRRMTEAAADYDNPYTVQASLGLSHQIGRDLVLDLSFLMYHGVHLPIALEGNYRESGQLVAVPGMPGSDLFGPRLARVDPSIAQIVVHSSEGNSIYYAMTASAEKRIGNHFQFRASYTYGKALDDVTDFSGGLTPYLPTRRYLDRGRSSFDLRHNFVASGTVESPFQDRQGQNWVARALADITLSPILTLRSGFPFNLYIGRDVNGDLNTTDRPFYAPRNSGVGENYYMLDLRVSKLFYFGRTGEGWSVEFIVEATNLFNHVNYLRVNDVVCGTTAQPGFINGCDPKFLTGPFDFTGVEGLPPTAPLAFVTADTARQFQFGLKFEF